MSGDTTEAAACADCGKLLPDGWFCMNGKFFCRDCFKAHGKDYERVLDAITDCMDLDKMKKEMDDDLLCQL